MIAVLRRVEYGACSVNGLCNAGRQSPVRTNKHNSVLKSPETTREDGGLYDYQGVSHVTHNRKGIVCHLKFDEIRLSSKINAYGGAFLPYGTTHTLTCASCLLSCIQLPTGKLGGASRS